MPAASSHARNAATGHDSGALATEPGGDSLAAVGAISKQTVLVSGSDPHLRARAREQLEAEGFDVVEAESDQEAWERYQAGGIERIVVAETFLKSH